MPKTKECGNIPKLKIKLGHHPTVEEHTNSDNDSEISSLPGRIKRSGILFDSDTESINSGVTGSSRTSRKRKNRQVSDSDSDFANYNRHRYDEDWKSTTSSSKSRSHKKSKKDSSSKKKKQVIPLSKRRHVSPSQIPSSNLTLHRVTSLLEVEPEDALRVVVNVPKFLQFQDAELARKIFLRQEEANNSDNSASGTRSLRQRKVKPAFFKEVSSGEEEDDEDFLPPPKLAKEKVDKDFDSMHDEHSNHSSTASVPPAASTSVAQKTKGTVFRDIRPKVPIEAKVVAEVFSKKFTELLKKVPAVMTYCNANFIHLNIDSHKAISEGELIEILAKNHQYLDAVEFLNIPNASVALQLENSFLTETDKILRSGDFAAHSGVPHHFFGCPLCSSHELFESYMDLERHYYLKHKGNRITRCGYCSHQTNRILFMLMHLQKEHPKQIMTIKLSPLYFTVASQFWVTQHQEFKCPNSDCKYSSRFNMNIRSHINFCFRVYQRKCCILCPLLSYSVEQFFAHMSEAHGRAVTASVNVEEPPQETAVAVAHQEAEEIDLAPAVASNQDVSKSLAVSSAVEFICRVCKVRSSFMGLIEAHMQTHRFVLLVRCGECMKLVERDWTLLAEHFETEHKSVPEGQRFYHESPSHIIYNKEKYVYSCPYCEYTTVNIVSINGHYCDHKVPVRPVSNSCMCYVCDTVFSAGVSQDAVVSHMVNHHKVCAVCARLQNSSFSDVEDPEKNCNYCKQLLQLAKNVADPTMWFSDRDLDTFIANKNANGLLNKLSTEKLHLPNADVAKPVSEIKSFKGSWQCRLCDSCFPNVDSYAKMFNLPNHLVKRHRLISLFACPKCNHRFSTEVLARQHIQRIHATLKNLIPHYVVEESNFFRQISVTSVNSSGTVVNTHVPHSSKVPLNQQFSNKSSNEPVVVTVNVASPSSTSSSSASAQDMKFLCKLCNKLSAPTLDEIEHHIIISHSSGDLCYKCPLPSCKETLFADAGSSAPAQAFEDHFQTHDQGKLITEFAQVISSKSQSYLKCQYCWTYSAESSFAALKHLESKHHVRTPQIVCPICSFLVCCGIHSFEHHINECHQSIAKFVFLGSIDFTVVNSNRLFAWFRHNVAIKIDETIGDYKCSKNDCDFTGNCVSVLREHAIQKHSGSGHNFCPLCNYYFTSLSDLHDHANLKHSVGNLDKADTFICKRLNCNFHRQCDIRDVHTHLVQQHSELNLNYWCFLCPFLHIGNCDLLYSHQQIDHRDITHLIFNGYGEGRIVGEDKMMVRRNNANHLKEAVQQRSLACLSEKTKSLVEKYPSDIVADSFHCSKTGKTLKPLESETNTISAATTTVVPPVSEAVLTSTSAPSPSTTSTKPKAATINELLKQATTPVLLPTLTAGASNSAARKIVNDEAQRAAILAKGLVYVPSYDIVLLDKIYQNTDVYHPVDEEIREALRPLRVLPTLYQGQASTVTNYQAQAPRMSSNFQAVNYR